MLNNIKYIAELKTIKEQHKPLANGCLLPAKLACFPLKDDSLSAGSQKGQPGTGSHLHKIPLGKEESFNGILTTSQAVITINSWIEAEYEVLRLKDLTVLKAIVFYKVLSKKNITSEALMEAE